jgi:hypothetical protein
MYDDRREHAIPGREGMFGKNINKYSPKISKVLKYLSRIGVAMVDIRSGFQVVFYRWPLR